MKIPIYKPSIGAAEARAVAKCVESGWISSKGAPVGEFEAAFAAFVGARYGVAVSSGTAALHCALVAAGVKPGDEVIVPALTYVATANAVVHAGATPVFCDVDPDNWCLDEKSAIEKITEVTTAVVPVELYGYPMEPHQMNFGEKIKIVADNAEAIGTERESRATAAWSFFANKTITTGEGGMVTTDDPMVADSARRLAHQGLIPGSEYKHDRVGYNYRMTAIQAAIGLAQLKRVKTFLKAKQWIYEMYRAGFKNLPITLQASHPGHSWWLVSGWSAWGTNLRGWLAAREVETRPVFPPVCCQPAYRKGGCKNEVAHRIATGGFSLPSWPGMKVREVEFVIGKIKEFFQ